MSALVKELMEAGVHYGHRASRWNPKMRPYIYARKNLIHIIDVRETVRGLLRAKKYLQQLSSQGSLILFVGTKRQAADAIEREAGRCGMPFVSERWVKRRAAGLPHVTALTIHGAAHAINFSHPEQLANVVRRWMADQPIVDDPTLPGRARVFLMPDEG